MGRQTYMWNDITLSPAQAAQALYSAGLRDLGIMKQLVSLAKRESGYRAGIHGSDSAQSRVSGDRGIWQINAGDNFQNGIGSVDRQLMAAGIIRTPEDLFDPVTNARAALWLLGGPQASPQSMQNALNHHWGAGPGGWVGASGDPMYGVDTSVGENAVNEMSSTGQLQAGYTGPGYVAGQGTTPATAPPPIVNGNASGAAGPGANPGTADLGFVNANAQNQRDYYTKQAEYNTNIFNLSQAAYNLQFDELEANKLYQWALHGVYTDVNRAQGIFNTREYDELKKNIGNLQKLADQGKAQTQQYRDLQYKIERDTLTATTGWLNKQRGFADKTKVLADAESAFIHGEQVRKTFSENTQRGSVHSQGFGADLAAHDTQRGLARGNAQLARDVDYGRLAHEEQQARTQYEADTRRISFDWNQYMNQYGIQQEQFRNQGAQGQLRYDQTAKQLWAKARELAAQKTLQDKMVDINYKGIQNQRDVGYQEYLRSHHSLQNQHTQVGVNQLRDISALNQQRMQAANDALLSLSPYD